MPKVEIGLRLPTKEDVEILRGYLAFDQDNRIWLQAIDDNPACKLLVFGQPAIGFIVAQTVLDEAEIQMFWLEPKSRGKGIGSAAFMQTMDWFRAEKIKSISLEVAEDNHAAIGIYQKAGFIEHSIRKQYYRRKNGAYCNAIVMHAAI